MIAAIRALMGMAFGLVAVVAPAWGIYHLLRTPSCGSDGFRTYGPPCPDDVALWIVAIVLSLMVMAPLAVAVAGRQGGGGPVLLGPLSALIPFGLVAGAIVSGLGPASDPDTRWVAIIGAVIAALIAVRTLRGLVRRRRRRRAVPLEPAPSVAAPVGSGPGTSGVPAEATIGTSELAAASIATLHDQLSRIAEASARTQSDEIDARLRRLDDLRAAGSISAAEHAERRREILDEI